MKYACSTSIAEREKKRGWNHEAAELGGAGEVNLQDWRFSYSATMDSKGSLTSLPSAGTILKKLSTYLKSCCISIDKVNSLAWIKKKSTVIILCRF